jgi:transposase-like protein
MEVLKNTDRTPHISKGEKQRPRPGYFTPDELLKDFHALFLDESHCRQWLLSRLHLGSPACPGCHKSIEGMALQRFWEGKRIACRHCQKFFTARTGTFLDRCHMQYGEIVILAVFLALRIHPIIIAKILQCSTETIRLWEKKFQAIKQAHELGDAELINGN